MEFVKFFQGIIISSDKNLEKDGIGCTVQSSNLNEELGQVDYVFSDKTGTLTCNEMNFKHLMVDGVFYGDRTGYFPKDMPKDLKNVDFSDALLWKHLSEPKNHEKLIENLLCLGLCHDIIIESYEDPNTGQQKKQ